MKLGLTWNRGHNDGSKQEFLFLEKGAKYQEFLPAEIPVPYEVERAVELTDHLRSKVPLAVMSEKGHQGQDRGLVIKDSFFDMNEEFDFCRTGLVTRISFSGKKEGDFYDMSQLHRLHISVYGGRDFFHPGLSEMESANEEFNISLRWFDGKYDDWSNPSNWKKDGTDFSDSRTIFARYNVSPNFAINPKDKEGFQDKFREFKQSEPKRKRIIYSEDKDLSEKGIKYQELIGYGSVSNALGLPKADPSKLSPLEGTEFLFGKVLPQLEKFVRS